MELGRAARGRSGEGRRGADASGTEQTAVRDERRLPGPAAERLPRHLVRPGAARPRRLRGPRRRLGAPPPRPRRPDLHRPARPHRPGAARLQPRRGGRRVRARPRAPRRGRAERDRRRSSSARRRRSTRSCRPARSRSGSPRRSCSRTPTRRRSRSSPSRARSARRRGCATATSTCAATGCARRSSCATGSPRAMREFLSGEGFLEIETPVLTRSTPEGARDFLVPSRLQPGSFYALPQSPAALQAAADGRRLRALLPDRALLPRRGPARRPPARLHPARHRDVLRRRRRRDRRERAPAGRTCSARRGVEVELPMRRLPYDEAIARYGTDKPDLRFGLELVELTDVFRDSEFKAFRRAIEDGALVRGAERGQRGVLARRPRRARRRGAGAGRQGPGLGRRRGRRLALAGREVPLRARRSRRPTRRSGRSEGDVLLLVADSPAALGGGARRAAPPPGRAARPDRPGGERAHLDRRLAAARLERRRGALGSRTTTRSPRPDGEFDPDDPGAPGPRHTMSSGTVGKLAVDRSASATRMFNASVFAAIGIDDAPGGGAVRLPARRAPLRRAPAWRDRLRPRPDRRPAASERSRSAT